MLAGIRVPFRLIIRGTPVELEGMTRMMLCRRELCRSDSPQEKEFFLDGTSDKVP